MHPRAYWLYGIGNDSRTFSLFLTLSTICHMILFGMFIFVPSFKTERKSTLSIINVSMVALPAQKKAPGPELQLPVETQRPIVKSKAALKAYPKQPSKVSVTPREEKLKKSLKKETFKSSKKAQASTTN